jgi:hypothetical protein
VLSVFLAGEAANKFEAQALYNLTPPKGVAAEFGAKFKNVDTAYIDAKVRSGGDYGVTAEATNVTAAAGISSVEAVFWGVPADASHDGERVCPGPGGTEIIGCSAEGVEPRPFLRNPTSCEGPLTTSLAIDSWQDPGVFSEASAGLPAITGCGLVGFAPTLQVQPTSSVADSPTGLHVDLHLPQNTSTTGLAEADLRDATVTLPAGVSTNPAAAAGLAACTNAQIGVTSAAGVLPVTFTPAAAECPDAAKIGTVEVDTSLVDHPLLGSVYIAAPYENPFSSLLAIYLSVFDPQTGVVVKLAGHVQADPVTGQLTTTFTDSPQVPFEDFKLDFFAGPRAALASPEQCGTYTTTSQLTPWSAPPSGPAAAPSDSFQVTSGCVPGFKPAFTAGTTSTQAGAFSPLTLSFSRGDSEEGLAGLSVALPPGLIGKIAGVGRCSDASLAAAASRSGAAELASASCPASSLIGTVQTGAGAGPSPLFVAGKAYLTGPYKGAPYGVAVIVPAVAGPFDLGTVVIRQALFIDPNDAHVTAVSDPFPTILKGIPLHIRRVDVSLDRPGFTLNPSSCEPMAVHATLTSTGGANAPVSSRFQAAGCGALPFKPSFSASTQGKASKAGGASLTVRVTQKPGEADIHKVDLQLPKALPSRLSTLQKACTLAQFESNPAGCPEGSFIGTATATTPILGVPLTGPAILVSHGGAAFPDVEFLLQGEGVHITLDGKTDIKNGITYSRFETVPDAPISSFETVLPVGPHSILGAYVPGSNHYNFCGQRSAPNGVSLTLPTTLTAQNGTVVTQTTKLGVTGCAKVKALTRAQKLAAAMKACKKKKKANRASCAKQANRKYGPLKKKAKK